ncbi:hypothetical protein DVH24_033476 [Malus domestica]|uniref:TIR domain-containing protein n=1 Tax=Malus domestica TaxID=3750 RepID=A0A498JAU1_MALDO|nr:hypothetical protein DVH24_033476 [Malus domestica]
MGTRTQREASSSSKRWMHDVFLSFRGEDTRNNFTGHLCIRGGCIEGQLTSRTSMNAGVNVFIDNQLKRGKKKQQNWCRQSEGLRFLSSSSQIGWCLQHLVEIMDCRRTLGQIVLPVFYDVDPSHTGASFAQAFQKHEDTDKVARCITALTEASKLSGWDLKNTANGEEQYLSGDVGRFFAEPRKFLGVFISCILFCSTECDFGEVVI